MPTKRRSKFEKWYSDNRERYDHVSQTVRRILTAALKKEHIAHLPITARCKTLESALQKLRTKRYKSPKTEMTDLAGIRILTYTEKDAAKVCSLIRSTFTVDHKRSVDKSESLRQDKVGYRSFHFVCQFDETRAKLVEFQSYKDCVFEVQVRTVLQHAWAEIEHSRRYKFAGVLPVHLARNLNLIAGLLEVADKQISTLAHEIDVYRQDVARKTNEGDLQIEITSESLRALVVRLQKRLKTVKIVGSDDASVALCVQEAKDFGLKVTADIEKLATRDFIRAYKKRLDTSTVIGFIRDLMMWTDIEKYFTVAHKRHWMSVDPDTVTFLNQKYGGRVAETTFKKHNVSVEEDSYVPDYDDPPDEPPDYEPPDVEPPDFEPPDEPPDFEPPDEPPDVEPPDEPPNE